jgi:uncharacterized RDD family membrane protein YckC
VKCPKCDYLGFETGDRCRNCGYDFSFLSVAEPAPADYEIHPAAIDDVPVHVIDEMLDTHDSPIPSKRVAAAGKSPTFSELPLFTRGQQDDEPLIKLPAAPRAPLAVRRTPDVPRPRAVPRSRPSPAPVLQFCEEGANQPVTPAAIPVTPVERVPSAILTELPSRPAARVVAMLIDYAILISIDAAVVYFTLRMAGLAMDQWRLLTGAPMFAFLGLLKVAYFYAFTAVGGQTIGKMAVGTCVVADNGGPLDAGRAMRRTSAGLVSCLLLGLGFLPALFGDHRALHDRLAGTRVVRLRSV